MTRCSKIEDFCHIKIKGFNGIKPKIWLHKRYKISIFSGLNILKCRDHKLKVYESNHDDISIRIGKYLVHIKEFFSLRYIYIYHLMLNFISSRARSSVRQSTWLLTRWPGVRFPSSPPFLLSTNFLGGRDHFEI